MEKDKAVEVLFVEDSLDDSELTEFAMLQANDKIHFRHFKDGTDALNFIFARKAYQGSRKQTGLRLVLLDLGLPSLGGLDVLRQLRENEATKAVPVVILTSSRDQRDKAIAYELGANSYVVKPDGFDGYIKKIGSLAFYWSSVNERPN